MKHMRHWLMMVTLLCGLTANAHDFEVDGIFYNIISSSELTVEVTSRDYSENSYSGVVIIPSTVTYDSKIYRVIGIEGDAFSCCATLTSITIPESVTSIGYAAFYECSSLTSITIPENSQLTSIEGSAFFDCTSLTSITIPESVKDIGEDAFVNCTSLTSITIPESVIYIENSTFSGCSSLTSITIPESVMHIGSGAFIGTAWYDNQPNGIVYVGKVLYAYKGTMLEYESLKIAEGTVSVSACAFSQGCYRLTSINIPASVKNIGYRAFHGCTSLNEIIIEDSNEILNFEGSEVFYNCPLKNVYLGRNLSYYKDYSPFENMTKLKSVKIGNGVTYIGDHAFSDCRSLTSITIPESVTSIGDYAFDGCSSLTSITIPEGVTSIGDFAFDYCSSLTSIIIPESVTSIGGEAFLGCSSLTSIIIPESVTSIGDFAFGYCENLKEVYCSTLEPIQYNYFFYDSPIEAIYVPAYSLDLYMEADGWKDFNILPFVVSSNLVVDFSTEVSGKYHNIYIELTDSSGEVINKYLIGEKQSYTFYSLDESQIYNIYIKNQSGHVLGVIQDIHINGDTNVTFDSLLQPQNVKIGIYTPDGTDVTESAIVTWVDVNNNYLSKGAALSGQVENTEVKYSVKLSKELAMQYKQPEQTTYMVKPSGNEIKVILEPFSTAEITGMVRDSVTGTPISDAMVTFSQKLNGEYAHITRAETDSKGAFKATLYDVPAEVTVAAADYISYTMSLDTLTEATALGDILMKPISGVVVSVGFTYRTSVPDGDTPEILGWYTDYDNVKYGILNKTTGLPVSNFSVQYPQLVLLDGVSAGDELLLTVVSRTGSFEPTQTTAVVDSTLQCDATFDIVELGGIEASYTTTTNSAVVGILYNEIGEMVQKRSYSSGSLTIDNLRDGSYTLVTMGSSDYFNAIYNMAQLSAVGLVEGTDYVKHAVKVESGVVSVVEMESVPAFDESKLYYTGGDTRFTVNKTSATAGNYLTLTGKIDFKEEYASKVSDVSMVIDLPESAVFVDNSVMVGAAIAPYTLAGNRLTISLSNNYTERVRFCIIPTESGSYAPTAFAQFTVDGKEVLQPIGSAHYTIKDLSIEVPSISAKTTIPVSGTAIGQSTIQIYDNDVLIGETTSLANGVWSATCKLHEPYNLSKHRIHAKVITSMGLELTSEAKECMYDMNAVQVSKVTMINVAHPANSLTPCEYVTVFDFLHPAKSIPDYWYWPDYPEFTFLIEFTDNDTTKVSNVVLWVETCNGNQVPLNAEYDENKGLWVASGNFGSWSNYDIPTNVSLDFDCRTEALIDRTYINDESNELELFIEQNLKERESFWASSNLEEYDNLWINQIDSLLSLDTLDVVALDEVYKNVLSNDGSINVWDEPEYDSLLAVLDYEYEEWATKEFKSEMESLLNDLFVNSTMPNDTIIIVEENGCQYEYFKHPIAQKDLELLDTMKYDSYRLTDGTLVYFKYDDNSMEYIDVAQSVKYGIVKNVPSNVRSRISDNMFSNVDECVKNIAATMKNIKTLCETGEISAEEACSQLDALYGFVECYYTAILLDIDINLNKQYNDAIKTYDVKINKRIELKKICEGRINSYTERLKEATRLKGTADELLARNQKLLLDPGLSPEDFKALSEQCEALKNQVSGYNLEIQSYKKALVSENKTWESLENQLQNLKRAKSKINAVKSKINALLSKLPKKMTPGSKVAKIVGVGGKLAGFFGEAIRVWSFGCDVLAALEEIDEWAQLQAAIIKKLPCENDKNRAETLKTQIDADADRVVYHFVGILSSEFMAIPLDLIGGVPVLSPTWWISSSLDIYAEWAKFLVIEKHYLPLRGNYYKELMTLKCIPKNCGEPGMPPCPPNPNNPNDPKPNNPNPNNPYPHPYPNKPNKGGNNGGKHKSNNPNVGGVHDPSGYVYEGVSSNRLEGVMASCYYKETVEDIYGDQHENVVLWDAEQYAQENPLFTDANGMYRWDVPKGLWQVKFEKEGYETTFSEWLPVPPPQLEVNIPMVQNKQPEVAGVHAYKDGVEIEFDKYMQPATLNTDNIFVTQNDEKVAGKVTLLNEEVAYEGQSETYASKVRFVFDQPITAKEITLTVVNSVKSYAGLQMQDVYTQTFAIEQEVEGIVADSLVSMYYGGEQTLTVKVIPAAAAAGKTLVVTSSSPMILGVDTDSIVLDDSGEAVLTVSGELPGMGAISYSLVGYDYRASTLVEVVYNNTKMTANPTASIASGTTVKKGTEVTLSCSTEGAAIYYTLDGSCPCDDTAILYDGTPIVINENTELRIMAVAEGMYESDVVVYNYYVEGADVEEVTLPFGIDPTIVTDGFRVQGIETECTVAVYGVGGELVMQREHVKNNTFINIAHVPEGMYIVVVSKDDDTHKQRILKVK